MNKNAIFGLLVIGLVFGFIGCENENVTTTYSVTFNSNGGSIVPAITGIESGSTITLPEVPIKVNYVFSGWFSDNETFLIPFTPSTTVTANITVYAKWTIINPVYAPVNGTLFSAVGAYADKTSFTYENKQWWIVTHNSYNWDNADPSWENAKNHNGIATHTRIAYFIPEEFKTYENMIITYDMILISGNYGDTSIEFRNTSDARGGVNANIEVEWTFLEIGNNKTFTIPISAFYNNPNENAEDGWVAFTKAEGGITDNAMLFRISKIEFIN